jgi:MoxR-like ATPase
VFCNILLADEINRAPAKVQSALLEVMQERQVTIGKQTFSVGDPFLVLATQNPIESEGTYPLPEAQVDRFLMKVVVDYPEPAEEVSIVTRSLGDAAVIQQALPIETLHKFQRLTREVYVDRAVTEYAVRLANATRHPGRFGLGQQQQYIAFGASPRGPISLVQASRALALLRGRRYVLPQDVYDLAKDVLRHRLVMNYQALAEGITADRVLDAVIASIQLPRIDLGDEATA